MALTYSTIVKRSLADNAIPSPVLPNNKMPLFADGAIDYASLKHLALQQNQAKNGMIKAVQTKG